MLSCLTGGRSLHLTSTVLVALFVVILVAFIGDVFGVSEAEVCPRPSQDNSVLHGTLISDATGIDDAIGVVQTTQSSFGENDSEC